MKIEYEVGTNYTLGLECLDKRFGCPAMRELIIIFGYMSSGKTEFAYFMARKNVDKGNKVCFISLELPEYDMKLRICRKRAGVSKYDFQNKKYTEQQKFIMEETWREIQGNGVMIVEEQKNKSIDNIIEAIRFLNENRGVTMFVLDNLDKITTNDRDEMGRYQTITSSLQDLKNELNLCIILIHHANKPSKKDVYNPAGMAGMRGSQKIMDNATQVFEIYRDLDPQASDDSKKRVELSQIKDTFEGANGYVEIAFEKGDYIPYTTILPQNTAISPQKENPF